MEFLARVFQEFMLYVLAFGIWCWLTSDSSKKKK